MPLAKRWSSFTLDNVDREGQIYGVYEMGDRDGEIVYIGHGVLSDRLRSHFIQGTHPIPGAAYYRVEPTRGKLRPELSECEERKMLSRFISQPSKKPSTPSESKLASWKGRSKAS